MNRHHLAKVIQRTPSGGHVTSLKRSVIPALCALALTGAALATAATRSLTLTPRSVERGHLVSIKGSADGCPAGDTALVLSRAFVHRHDFAGVPAVLAKVGTGGAFRATTRIPATTKPGRYGVTARCGGGNLGVLKYLTVNR